MEKKEAKLGSSLLVPCVQEMVEEDLSTVPPRYIRPELDLSVVSDDVAMPDIPVIDMTRLLAGESMESELLKLHLACKEWGFFQVLNHGISSSLLDKLKKEIEEFFNMDMEEKKKMWQNPGEVEGFGQAFVVSEEQKLDWGDIFFVRTLPIHFRKSHLFHNLSVPFRDTLDIYSHELKKLAMELLLKMAKVLNMEVEEMEDMFGDGMQMMRMNYYPPCPEPEKVIGLTPHSDPVALTILLQINEVEGLQIKKDGKWISVKPLPNAFIVNIGDILEIITNGEYRSIEHRATVNSRKERLSIATLYSPRHDGHVEPATSLITQQTPVLFKRVTVEEYFRCLFSRELYGKSYLDAMRIQREGQN